MLRCAENKACSRIRGQCERQLEGESDNHGRLGEYRAEIAMPGAHTLDDLLKDVASYRHHSKWPQGDVSDGVAASRVAHDHSADSEYQNERDNRKQGHESDAAVPGGLEMLSARERIWLYESIREAVGELRAQSHEGQHEQPGEERASHLESNDAIECIESGPLVSPVRSVESVSASPARGLS